MDECGNNCCPNYFADRYPNYVFDKRRYQVIHYQSFCICSDSFICGVDFYGATQQQGNLKEKNFTAVRYGDTLHVTSKTPWLQSKEFTIHSENDDAIYIKDGELYEIKKSEFQRP